MKSRLLSILLLFVFIPQIGNTSNSVVENNRTSFAGYDYCVSDDGNQWIANVYADWDSNLYGYDDNGNPVTIGGLFISGLTYKNEPENSSIYQSATMTMPQGDAGGIIEYSKAVALRRGSTTYDKIVIDLDNGKLITHVDGQKKFEYNCKSQNDYKFIERFLVYYEQNRNGYSTTVSQHEVDATATSLGALLSKYPGTMPSNYVNGHSPKFYICEKNRLAIYVFFNHPNSSTIGYRLSNNQLTPAEVDLLAVISEGVGQVSNVVVAELETPKSRNVDEHFSFVNVVAPNSGKPFFHNLQLNEDDMKLKVFFTQSDFQELDCVFGENSYVPATLLEKYESIVDFPEPEMGKLTNFTYKLMRGSPKTQSFTSHCEAQSSSKKTKLKGFVKHGNNNPSQFCNDWTILSNLIAHKVSATDAKLVGEDWVEGRYFTHKSALFGSSRLDFVRLKRFHDTYGWFRLGDFSGIYTTPVNTLPTNGRKIYYGRFISSVIYEDVEIARVDFKDNKLRIDLSTKAIGGGFIRLTSEDINFSSATGEFSGDVIFSQSPNIPSRKGTISGTISGRNGAILAMEFDTPFASGFLIGHKTNLN